MMVQCRRLDLKPLGLWEDIRHFINRGSKSRNKVAVGEPAAGSFSDDNLKKTKTEGSLLLRGVASHNTKNNKPFCRSRARFYIKKRVP